MNIMSLLIKVLGILVLHYIVVKSLLMSLTSDYLKSYRLYKKGEHALGVIVSFETKQDLDWQNQYDSIIEFIAEDGYKYTINAGDSKYIKPKINKKVDVFYSEDDPLNVIINPKSTLCSKLFLILFALFIILCVNVGFFSLFIKDEFAN